jgi:hypothetical protein
MKQKILLSIAFVASLIMSSCSSGSISDDFADADTGATTASGGTTSTATALSSDLTSFDVVVDSTSLNETETIPTDNEDYIENSTFSSVVNIVYNGSSASYSGSADGVTVTVNGADVTVNSTAKNVAYVLSGSTTDGSFKVYSDKKFEMKLNGVSIKNPTAAAINVQSSKRCFVILADGTTNTLIDGTSYTDKVDGEDMKGTLFSEGQMLFSGSGKLRVYANCKAGISSDDYVLFRPNTNIYVKSTSGNGIKANDAIIVKGGVINVETSATASKGLSCDGYVEIDGGRTTAITTGGGEFDEDDNDASGCAGVKSDSIFTMNGGELLVKSTGAGGKGVSSDQKIIVNDGTIRAITTGKKYTYGSYDTSPKGIKSDGNMSINGGDVMVRATGGEGAEGIESKGTLQITSGLVRVYAYDDGINSAGALTISGGYVFSYATNNDGIDSNSTLTVSGGVAIASGTTQPEDGFDCDQNTFNVTGGTLVGIGGGTSAPTSSTAKQPTIVVGGSSLTADSYITLASSDGTNIFAFKVPRSYSQYTLLISSPKLSIGSSYVLCSGSSISGGTDFCGYITGATVSSGSTLANLTLSSTLTTYNYSTGMGGGGGPGMR